MCLCVQEMLPTALMELRGLNLCVKKIWQKLHKQLWLSWGRQQKQQRCLGVPTFQKSFQTWIQIPFVRHTKAFLCSSQKPRSKPERLPSPSGKGKEKEKTKEKPQNKQTHPPPRQTPSNNNKPKQTHDTSQNRSELRNNNNKKQYAIMMKYPWKKWLYQANPAAKQSVITEVHWMTPGQVSRGLRKRLGLNLSDSCKHLLSTVTTERKPDP